jgi:hypothetical protein
LKRISFYSVIILLMLTLTACATFTILDRFIYPSEYFATRLTDERSIAICDAMEAQNYVFDEFAIGEYGYNVIYPDGETSHIIQNASVHPVVVTVMARDYNNPDLFSDEEWHRIENSAVQFCHDYYATVDDLELDLPLSGVLYWDYINGIRGGFQLSDSCEIVGGYGWGSGSYASTYAENSTDTCPSGSVEH